jgi:Lrp/AsnC family transcriptional regulator, regulator for asnA, asnC and gidA
VGQGVWPWVKECGRDRGVWAWIEECEVNEHWSVSTLGQRTRRRPWLDETDGQIMALLRQDGRCSYRLIADRTELSESAVRHRVARLQRNGVMRITILSDPIAMGLLAAQLHVRVGGRQAADVARELAALDETDFVAVGTGERSIVVNLVCDDHEHLVQVVDQARGIGGVLDLDLSLLLRIVKNTLEW